MQQAQAYFLAAKYMATNQVYGFKISGTDFLAAVKDLMRGEITWNMNPILCCDCEDTYQAAIGGIKKFFKEREEYVGVFSPIRWHISQKQFKALSERTYSRIKQSGLIALVIK